MSKQSDQASMIQRNWRRYKVLQKEYAQKAQEEYDKKLQKEKEVFLSFNCFIYI